MNKHPFLLRSLVVALAAAGTSSAFAAGFQLNGQSATGLGRAFAGDAVIADNASVMARNPAAMSLFERPEISLGLVVIDTAPKVKNAVLTTTTPLSSASSSIADEEIGSVTSVPDVYYLHPVDDQLTLGAGIYSHFGTSTEFGDDYAAGLFFGGKTELSSINLGLSASYRINKQISLGAGLDFIQGSGTLLRNSSTSPPPLPTSALNIEADGIDLGWNIGAVYELNENNRFGLSYRYSPEVGADIENGSTVTAIVGGNFVSVPLTGDLILKLPDIAEFSGYHVLDPQFAVHYSIQWIGWSAFDTLETSEGVILNEYNWQDGWHFSLGGTYKLNRELTLRAGYMYDTSAQDEITSISVPDSDRHWLSAGLSYTLAPNSVFDFGLTYLIGRDVDVFEEALDGAISVNATTRANAWLYGVQYTYKF